VIDGKMYDTPVLEDQYNVDVAGLIRVAYTSPGDSSDTSTANPVTEYRYTLVHNKFHLEDTSTHFTYDFIVFKKLSP